MKTPSKREILVLTGHLCPKCNEFTELVESSEIYGTDFGLLYRCPTCHAYVGCHKGSLNAKGVSPEETFGNFESRPTACSTICGNPGI